MGIAGAGNFIDGRRYLWLIGLFHRIKKHVAHWRCFISFHFTGHLCGFYCGGVQCSGLFTGSVIAGLITAVAITWIQRNVKTKNDAAIGIVFTAMFSLGVMGISHLNNSQGNHLDLKDFLFGNVLGISNEDIVLTAIILIYTLASILFFLPIFFCSNISGSLRRNDGHFYRAVHYFLMLMLSFAVVAALRSVGVILVVAMLITPASTAMLISHKLKTIPIIIGCFGSTFFYCRPGCCHLF